MSQALRAYLKDYGRHSELSVSYDDLLGFTDSMPLVDQNQRDILWETTCCQLAGRRNLKRGLTKIYSLLKTSEDTSIMEHLAVDRVNYCTFGNSNRFRIRIVNQYNDNHDYFYIKKADASRIYET